MQMVDNNNDMLWNMELDKEINQFENSDLNQDSRQGSKLGFMHSRPGSQMSSINRPASRGLEMDADEESQLLAMARSRTRSNANAFVNIPTAENMYSTP